MKLLILYPSPPKHSSFQLSCKLKEYFLHEEVSRFILSFHFDFPSLKVLSNFFKWLLLKDSQDLESIILNFSDAQFSDAQFFLREEMLMIGILLDKLRGRKFFMDEAKRSQLILEIPFDVVELCRLNRGGEEGRREQGTGKMIGGRILNLSFSRTQVKKNSYLWKAKNPVILRPEKKGKKEEKKEEGRREEGGRGREEEGRRKEGGGGNEEGGKGREQGGAAGGEKKEEGVMNRKEVEGKKEEEGRDRKDEIRGKEEVKFIKEEGKKEDEKGGGRREVEEKRTEEGKKEEGRKENERKQEVMNDRREEGKREKEEGKRKGEKNEILFGLLTPNERVRVLACLKNLMREKKRILIDCFVKDILYLMRSYLKPSVSPEKKVKTEVFIEKGRSNGFFNSIGCERDLKNFNYEAFWDYVKKKFKGGHNKKTLKKTVNPKEKNEFKKFWYENLFILLLLLLLT